jgi:hypothetical protein
MQTLHQVYKVLEEEFLWRPEQHQLLMVRVVPVVFLKQPCDEQVVIEDWSLKTTLHPTNVNFTHSAGSAVQHTFISKTVDQGMVEQLTPPVLANVTGGTSSSNNAAL